MQKIITLFKRDFGPLGKPITSRWVTDEVTPGAEWVIAGEGVATRKFDGTCCLVRGGVLYRRYELPWGKLPPPEFKAVADPVPPAGKTPGWLPVGNGPGDRWHREAFMLHPGDRWSPDGPTVRPGWPEGTYELCGPKVQGNPEGFALHHLVPHGAHKLPDFPRTFAGIKAVFARPEWVFEGVVWHHPDGRMVKIKKRDFKPE